jgi:hypothetical protein
MVVSGEQQLVAQRVCVERRALLQLKGMRGDVGSRTQTAQRRLRGCEQHVEVALQDPMQRRQALRDQVGVRGKVVVRQRLPVRQHANAQPRREPGDLLGKTMRVVRACADDRYRIGARSGIDFLSEPADGERIRRAGKARIALPGGQVLAQHPIRPAIIQS